MPHEPKPPCNRFEQARPGHPRLRAWTFSAALAIAMLSFLAATPSKPGIYVKVSGLHNAKGRLRCGLFKTEKNWLGELPFGRAQGSIRDGRATCAFHDVEPGVYAVTVLHDEDDDGEMDKSALGLPREGYGASRNATRKGVGAPDWNDAKFRYEGERKILKLRVEYP